nr:hypothetical protein CFP56_04268 [Quercus suber]
MVVPFTANAPFMQKSDYPEGTIFIAVGAVLAFLGACILLWRGLVAWSINRSVKRSAMASIRSTEKHPSTWGSSGYAPVKDSFYKDVGSSMSMDALNHAGKPLRGHHKNDDVQRSATPPAGLFFSPTAQAGQGGAPQTRGSTYLPAGYYATSSAQAAGGAGSTTVGGPRAPYARQSRMEPSPPGSRGSVYHTSSRDNLRAASRDGYTSARNSHLDPPSRLGQPGAGLYSSPSTTSLGGAGPARHPLNDSPAGSRAPSLAGSRAPSAYLDDLFENHGHGPRERF